MRVVTILIFIAAAQCLAGCAPHEPYVIQTAYSDADFQPWTGPGTATLRGQAFLKTVGGDVKMCAGETVSLMPATAYNKEVMSPAAEGDKANRDPSADKYVRTTVCDGEGRFVFANLPAKEWLVQARVVWGVPTGGHSLFLPDVQQQGGFLLKDVVLSPGENAVVMADADIQ